MDDEPERLYKPSSKHKRPKGFGTLCPTGLDLDRAQALLTDALAITDVPEAPSKGLWAVDGLWCFCALPEEPNSPLNRAWHGYPWIGSDVPYEVLLALKSEGLIDRRQLKRLRKQRSLPDQWPS